MHARVSFILDRLNADFAAADMGSVTYVLNPGPDWAAPVWAFKGSETACAYDDVESAIATLANTFQDDVISSRLEVWPSLDGVALLASAKSGVACWCLAGKPWCAVGQLTAALSSHAEGSGQ